MTFFPDGRTFLLVVNFSVAFFLLVQPVSSQASVNFGEHIAPLVFKKCTPCHQADGPGPMPFTNYREVAAYGAMIAFVTKSRYMPPWPAEKDYGHFAGDLSLSEAEIQRIQLWAANGFRRGPKLSSDNWRAYQHKLPAVTEEWDLEVEMDTAFEQYDIYFDQFQVFRIPIDLAAGQWVKEIRFTPGDPTIVRYVSVALDAGDQSVLLDKWDPRYGYTTFAGPGFLPDTDAWFTWSIGAGIKQYHSPGLRYLPAKTNLLVYIHYGPTATTKFDKSKLQFKFATDREQGISRSVSLLQPMQFSPNEEFGIKASEQRFFRATTCLPEAILLFALEPQALLLCEQWEIFARLPDGEVIKILKIPDYDFHWRQEYALEQPLWLPAGTELIALARYDNRSQNPSNPINPPIDVSWGYRLFNEQFRVAFRFSFSEHQSQVALLSFAPNATEQIQRIRIAGKFSEPLDLLVQHFSDTSRVVFQQIYPSDSGQQDWDIPVGQLAYGNCVVRLLDGNGNCLATDFFVHWPPGLAKSILDD